MGRSKKRSVAEPPKTDAPKPPFVVRFKPHLLALLGGVLAFLGFAGFGIWPLAFVAYVPLFFALDAEKERRGKRAVLFGFLFGFVGHWGGYYWLVEMLANFSGFGLPLCILFASVLVAYTAGGFTLFAWLWARATERGANATLAAVLAFLAAELLYPLLFPFYYGASFHSLPLLMQVADLGGPLLVSALAIVVNAALFELLRARLERRPLPRRGPIAALGYVAFVMAYGGYRMHEVDMAVRAAPKVTVGLVQTNMGLLQKREDPWEGLRRHIDQSLELERTARPDLLVWPESAYTFFLPDGIQNVREHVLGRVSTPVLFGGLQRRQVGGRERHYNTAFITDREGNVAGTYDKTYLLAFGEYLPFGETFPKLYEISRHSGRFTPGDHVRPLPFGDFRLATLICYEDILPGFVRRAVAEGRPHLLVNVTNDAWFGDTHEPWIHLALAKFRAIEHHRYLVRATNSGASAVVDPVGRTVVESGVFTRESLHAEVAMIDRVTLFELAGEWPGWVSVAGILFFAFVRRRRAPV